MWSLTARLLIHHICRFLRPYLCQLHPRRLYLHRLHRLRGRRSPLVAPTILLVHTRAKVSTLTLRCKGIRRCCSILTCGRHTPCGRHTLLEMHCVGKRYLPKRVATTTPYTRADCAFSLLVSCSVQRRGARLLSSGSTVAADALIGPISLGEGVYTHLKSTRQTRPPERGRRS